jgi:hypothetical protein
MTCKRRCSHFWRAPGTAIVATLAIVGGFLAVTIAPASAATTTTSTTTTTAPTTTTTAVPGSNCSAPVRGTALDRTGWSASTNAPSSSADVPANALDGNFSTRFSTNEHQAPGLALRVDLGALRVFDEVAMRAPNSPADYARGYQVTVSANNSTWAVVAACTGTANPEVVGFPAQKAQWVRVVLTAATTTNWWSIDELDLYGTAAATTTTTTRATTTTTRATTTTLPTSVLPAPGYWLATANGQVYDLGAAKSFGGMTTSGITNPVVGMAATPTAKGYWVVTADGGVGAFGDAKFYGDLPDLGKHVRDVVAIAPTTDGRGYYLVGADGGFFTFGDAKFHGSLPGIHLHVKDVVGVVATPGGSGYLLVGADGGVFTFGATRFYGSLPGIGKRVHDIRAILPSSTGRGYILVGADGGAFNFGTGAKFHGSLPGEHVSVSDIVGIALTPDDGGYWMAGTHGRVYGFGDAHVWAEPGALASNLPVAAIAGT